MVFSFGSEEIARLGSPSMVLPRRCIRAFFELSSVRLLIMYRRSLFEAPHQRESADILVLIRIHERDQALRLVMVTITPHTHTRERVMLIADHARLRS